MFTLWTHYLSWWGYGGEPIKRWQWIQPANNSYKVT